MATDSYLIHSGLPWTSPQKIIISSGQYINNITINRGLLNLLNNDYYLDIKTEALNNYIERNLGQHLKDTDIHVSWSRINELFNSVKIATKDCAYYIPITWNGNVQYYSNIQNILNLLPKNLNGHTIILKLCHGYTSQIPTFANNIIDIASNCLEFNGFNSGDIVIYNSRDKVKLTDFQTLASLQINQADALQLFNEVQEKINRKAAYNQAENLLIQSTGLNHNYSTISIKNSSANVYLLNLGIQNTLSDWTTLQTKKRELSQLPSKQVLLNYFSLTQTEGNKILNKEEYLNSFYLYKSNSYPLYYSKSNANSLVVSSTIGHELNNSDSSIIHYTNLNTINNSQIPDYFSFDFNQTADVSNELREYIYNWNGTTKGFSILFFGHLSENELNFSNCPIFSDYSINSQNIQQGLYVYLNKLYRSNNNGRVYPFDLQKYYSKMTGESDWGLYVLQFVHDNSLLENSTFGTLNFANKTSVLSAPILSNELRINLYFYPYTMRANDSIKPYILSPNINTLNNVASKTTYNDIKEYFKSVGYQLFNFPKSNFQDYSNSIKLFGNKKIYSTTESIKNWDYFSGSIKNLLLFNSILTPDQIKQILKNHFNTSYNFLSQSQISLIENISSNSYLGGLSVLNSNNVNIIGCKIQV